MKKVSLFCGRFQPWNNGHHQIFEKSKYPVVVCIVKGKQTSKDLDRNPFDIDFQLEMVKSVGSSEDNFEKVIMHQVSYYPDIIDSLKEDGFEVRQIFSGPDRVKDYKRQLKEYPNVVITLMDRITESTIIRKAILSNDNKTVKANIPKSLYKLIPKMHKIMISNKSSAEEGTINLESLQQLRDLYASQ